MDEIAEIDRLLELHNGLWQTAAILQVNADESRILIPDFQQSYHAWYYRALRVLPDDLRPGFKQQYEGLPENGAWGTTVVVGIRQFLEDPLKTYKDVGPVVAYSKQAPPKPTKYAWSYPCDYYFRPKFLSQVMTLRQAREFHLWAAPTFAPTVSGPSEAISTVELLRSRTVFVGHGRGNLYRVAVDFLRSTLGLEVVTFESEPTGGLHNIERLEQMLYRAGFAVIVATADDVAADGEMQARLNVIHEIGLFQGRLSFRKVALMRQEGTRQFSNLSGYQELRFNGEDIKSKFEDLRGMLRREGMQFKEPAN